MQKEQVSVGNMITLREAAERSKKSQGALRILCEEGRIQGATKVHTPSKDEKKGGRDLWYVPVNYSDDMIVDAQRVGRGRLSEKKKNNIARAYLNNEKSGGELAKQYGIDVSYPRKLILRGYPKDGAK